MSRVLALLDRTKPGWFNQPGSMGCALTGVARVEETIWHRSGVPIVIRDNGALTVAEQTPGQVFPARCPERHIQSDQTFCVGLRKIQIPNTVMAVQWWEQLRQYLVCQSVAEETGIWPLNHALDHGQAGEYHEHALTLAAELGLEAEYGAAYLGESSWITNDDLKLIDKQGKAINGRIVCPRHCPHKRGGRHLLLRRNCKRRSKIIELVRAERNRRRALEQYWADCAKVGETCCGRMRKCGLPPPVGELEKGVV